MISVISSTSITAPFHCPSAKRGTHVMRRYDSWFILRKAISCSANFWGSAANARNAARAGSHSGELEIKLSKLPAKGVDKRNRLTAAGLYVATLIVLFIDTT